MFSGFQNTVAVRKVLTQFYFVYKPKERIVKRPKKRWMDQSYTWEKEKVEGPEP
jgi:hypothetical protein